MNANYWKNGVSIVGDLSLKKKSIVFTSNNLFNLHNVKETIMIDDIIGVELETIFNPLLRINLKDGTSRTFTVWDRATLRKKILELKNVQ